MTIRFLVGINSGNLVWLNYILSLGQAMQTSLTQLYPNAQLESKHLIMYCNNLDAQLLSLGFV